MSKVKLEIWGRKFILPVRYECGIEEEILPVQEDAIEGFLKASKDILKSDEKIIQYCLKDDKNEDVREINNVFKYVMPVSILVLRSTKKHIVALMCNYKFDIEHGIAVCFENEKLKKICSQDSI